MDKFIRLDGLVAPLDRANVDTHAIIAQRFLKSSKRPCFGLNLLQQWVLRPDGQALPFAVDPFRRECLRNGWDHIGLTLHHAGLTRAFEERRRSAQPWLFA